MFLDAAVNISINDTDIRNTTTNRTDESYTIDDDDMHRSLPETIIIALLLCVVILATIFGNLLVCITILTDRKLQTTTNFFILSLSVTDLLLGTLVLPVSAYTTVQPHWVFGPILCNIYVACDVTLCTVSILTLFAISLDRYFAVTVPLRYRQLMRRSVVFRLNAAIWFLSASLAFIPIHLGWNTPDGRVQNYGDEGGGAKAAECLFELNAGYVFLIALGTYFAPLGIMCGVYLRILTISRRQAKAINGLNASVKSACNVRANGMNITPTSLTLMKCEEAKRALFRVTDIQRRVGRNGLSASRSCQDVNGETDVVQGNEQGNKSNRIVSGLSRCFSSSCLSDKLGTETNEIVKYGENYNNGQSLSSQPCVNQTLLSRYDPIVTSKGNCDVTPVRSRLIRLPLTKLPAVRKPKDTKLVSESRATVTLATVMLAFAICWVPYFALFITKPFLRSKVNVHFELFVLWLGYLNSSINPFLYAFYNASFRDGFCRVLRRFCCCVRFRRRSSLFSSSSSSNKSVLFSSCNEIKRAEVSNERINRIALSYSDTVYSETTHLDSIHLQTTHLDSIHLQTTHFHLDLTHLQTTRLDSSQLQATHLDSSHLQATHLDSSQLQATHLDSSHLQATHLDSSQLQATHLDSSHLQSTHLDSSHLQSTHLDSIHLEATHLDSTLLDSPNCDSTHVTTSPLNTNQY